MLTDDPRMMEQRLTTYVQDARQALETLEGINPDETVDVQSEAYRRYVEALNALNQARAWLGMAVEHLHDRLNSYNDWMISAAQEAREDAAKAKQEQE